MIFSIPYAEFFFLSNGKNVGSKQTARAQTKCQYLRILPSPAEEEIENMANAAAQWKSFQPHEFKVLVQ